MRGLQAATSQLPDSACAGIATIGSVGLTGARRATGAVASGSIEASRRSTLDGALSERAAPVGIGLLAVISGPASGRSATLSKRAPNELAAERCLETKPRIFGISTTMTNAIKAARKIAKR